MSAFQDTGLEDDRWWWQVAAVALWFSLVWAFPPVWTGILLIAMRDEWLWGSLLAGSTVMVLLPCVYAVFFTGYSNAIFSDRSRREVYHKALGGSSTR